MEEITYEHRIRIADYPFGCGTQFHGPWFTEIIRLVWGYGQKGTGGWMESIGIKPGVAMAVMAGLMEFAGGLLFAAGLGTIFASLLIALTMVMAIAKVHGKTATGTQPAVMSTIFCCLPLL